MKLRPVELRTISRPGMLAAALLLAGYTGAAGQEFDAEAWRDNRESAWCRTVIKPIFGGCNKPRERMWRAVRDEVLKPGMTRDEVRAILGEPDSEVRRTWYYDLGGGLIDPEYLAVFFDEAGRLTGSDFTQG